MKEKKTISINPRGIERAVNDINIPDGACDEIINLRLKDGAWRPLGGKVEFNDFSYISGYEDFTNIYSHSILGANKYIGVDGQDVILIETAEGISPLTYDSVAKQSTTQFNLFVYTNGAFTITKPAWMTLSSDSGEYAETIVVTVDASSTADRTGDIEVTGPNGIYSCTVSQEGIHLTATTPVSTDEDAKSLDLDIDILQTTSEFTSTEQSDVDSMINSLTDNQTTKKVTVDINENITASAKEATVRITHDDFPTVYQDVVINQDAAPFTVVAAETELEWAYDNTSTQYINVTILPDDDINYILDDTYFDVVSINQVTKIIGIAPKGTNPGTENYEEIITIGSPTPGYTTDNVTLIQTPAP